MKGDPKIISYLNNILANELTAINQYFLHARILENWGFNALGKKEYDDSIDEMKHADQVIKRILFLEGVPNVQKLNKINIGQSVKEILESDLKLEADALPVLKEGIKACEDQQDYVSRELMQSILASEEDHFDFLETQLQLIKKVGEQNYLQTQMGQ